MARMSIDLLTKVCDEIDARLAELRPFVLEYEQLLGAADAIGDSAAEPGVASPSAPAAAPAQAAKKAAKKPTSRAAKRPRGASAKPARAVRGAAEQAIVAALEHGSHTVGELVVVTAMSAANVRESLRRLQQAGTVKRATRDGKPAYALAVES